MVKTSFNSIHSTLESYLPYIRFLICYNIFRCMMELYTLDNHSIYSYIEKVPAVNTTEPVHYNVVFSYQWDSREVVQKVKHYLEKNKVTCWVDTDHVTGDKRPAVENAIEEADLCLMFYSFKYFISKNCRQGILSTESTLLLSVSIIYSACLFLSGSRQSCRTRLFERITRLSSNKETTIPYDNTSYCCLLLQRRSMLVSWGR